MSVAAVIPVAGRAGAADLTVVLARWLLGALFIFTGLNKALHPVEFLKLVRQYNGLHHPFLLNLVTSTLPWIEAFCGLMLLLGVAVRGTAVLLLVMLLSFSAAVLLRAMSIRETDGIPFCAIKFDCGCATGETPVCAKLRENFLLAALSAAILVRRSHRLCLRHSLFKGHSDYNPGQAGLKSLTRRI